MKNSVKSKLVPVMFLLLASVTQWASATVFDVRFTGVMQDNVYYYGGNPYQKYLTAQSDLVSNGMIGEAYDFQFRFDTSTSFVTDYSLPGFSGGQSFTLLSASYGGLADFSMYETQVVRNGTDVNGIDTLAFLLFRDLDEELGLPGAWDNQILFTIQNVDGGLFAALDNIDTQAFDNSIIDSASSSFFIHRNRNGLYTGQQSDVPEVFITSVNSSGSGASVSEPPLLALLGLGLFALGFTRRRKTQSWG